MKKITAIFCLLLPLLLTAQKDSIVSGVYDWKEPVRESTYAEPAILFEGQAHGMEWLQVSSNVDYTTKAKIKTAYKVPDNEEQIIIVKKGQLIIRVNELIDTLGAGSIALLMPGQRCSFRSTINAPCNYYKIKFRSRQTVNAERGKTAGGSTAVNWDTVTFKQSDKGGRRNFLDRSTAMSRRVEIHASTLKPGLKSHDPHTHIAPEMVIVTEGQTEMQIGTQLFKGSPGSIYFLASNVLHAIQNKGTGNCTYFAIQLE